MKDITGQPLKISEIENALQSVKKHLPKMMLLPPELAVEMLTIKLALEELLKYKEKSYDPHK